MLESRVLQSTGQAQSEGPFGFSPKISTTVENIVENRNLYLSSYESFSFSGVFGPFRRDTAEFLRVCRPLNASKPLSPAAV